MTILRLAWRNIWRQHRRSLILITAITLGVFAMVALAALARGSMEAQLHAAINNLTGHIQLHHAAYRDDPVIEHGIAPPSGELLKLLDGPEVEQWSPRIALPAVISSERESAGITLVGIDPGKERELSFIGSGVREGRYLQGVEDCGLLLGRKLADRLETRLGKRVVVMSQGADGELADRGFRVVGIFDAEMQQSETAYLFVGLKTAQKMLRIDNQISEIALRSDSHEGLEPLLSQLRSVSPDLEALDWQELQPMMKLMAGMIDAILVIWFVVVFLAMSFGLVNTLLMAVFERTREIGLLQALGMRPGLILLQVLIESLLLLSIGLLLGNGLAGLYIVWVGDGIDLSAFAEGMEMIGYAPVLYPSVRISDVVTANLLVVVLGILASLYPAWHAARTVPIEAINRS